MPLGGIFLVITNTGMYTKYEWTMVMAFGGIKMEQN